MIIMMMMTAQLQFGEAAAGPLADGGSALAGLRRCRLAPY